LIDWVSARKKDQIQGGTQDMTNRILRLAAIAIASVLAPNAVLADSHEKQVTAYVQKNVAPWLSDKTVINAVEASNKKHQRLLQADIDKMDKEWIAARKAKAAHAPMDALMKNDLATFLKKKREASKGVIVEFFVMDNRGLNVGQTDPTSDLWQADEAKWQKSFGAGPDGIFVDKVEEDGGLNVSQVSLTIADKKTKRAVGAITVVVDMGKLPK